MKNKIITLFMVFLLSSCAHKEESKKSVGKNTVIPAHKIYKTKNGIELYHFPYEATPLFTLMVALPVGGITDPKGKSGLTNFMTDLMRTGVEGYDEAAFSVRLDDLAASLNSAVTERWTIFTASGLNRESSSIYDLFFKMILEPTFPIDKFSRMKNNLLEGFDHVVDSPSSVAFRAVARIQYNGSKSARNFSGLLKDVSTLTIHDVKERYEEMLTSEGAKVALIGGTEANGMVQNLIGFLEKIPVAPKISENRIHKWDYKELNFPENNIVLIDKPGLRQSDVVFSYKGPSRKVPEYETLRAIENYLFESQNSLFQRVIREEKGLSYSISGGFRFEDELGLFHIHTATSVEKTAEVVLEIEKTYKGFLEQKGLSDPEIARLQNMLKGSFPFMLDNHYVLVQSYFGLLLGDVRKNFYDTYVDNISHINGALVRNVIEKYMHKNFRIVVVGDAKKIIPQLKKVGKKYTKVRPQQFL